MANEFVPPEERVLDWVPRHDPRSLTYPARSLFRREAPSNITWRTPAVPLDQGREGACVGFGWTHEALTTPVVVNLSRIKALAPDDPTAFALHVYRSAQRIDEWEGEAYDGTSVLAGAKIMKSLNLLGEYRWNYDIDDIALSLTNIGPVVIGIVWYDSMYYAPGGVVQVSGNVVGGHCLLVVGYRKPGVIFEGEAAYLLFNSWGPTWGKNGLAWISASNLSRLMRQDGEACVPTRRSYGR